MTRVDPSTPVGQLVAEHPRTARVLEELQIDYCCGGRRTLADACAQRQLDIDQTLGQLTEAVVGSEPDSDGDWLDMPLSELADHIEQTHHAYLREELPRLSAMVEKVENAHAENHPELHELRTVFAALRSELEPHMFKEEQILFPAIRQLEQAAHRPSFPFGTVANPIRMMEHEHDVAGSALAQIRRLTQDYRVPEGACNTYRVMLDSLMQLEQNTHQHIHKENNILFPKAQSLENKSGQAVN